MNTPYIEWCQKMRRVCDALAEKRLKFAKEDRECAVLINALKKMGVKPSPGLKSRQSSKDVGRSRISQTLQKKEPQMRSKKPSITPTQLGTCAQKQGAEKKNKKEGHRWCPGVLSQPSKTTKKPLGGQTKLVAAVLRLADSNVSTNRYTLLAAEPKDSSSLPSQNKVHGTDVASQSRCESTTNDRSKATLKAGSRGWMLNFLLKFSRYCSYHPEETKGPYQRILKALCLLHKEGIPWAEEANSKVSWWTLGVANPNNESNEVLWTKFKTYLLARVQSKQAPARLASDHADVVLRMMHTKAQAKGSSPLEKKEQKETREEHARKIIHAKLVQKDKKTPEQLPALLPPKDGHTPAQQAVQEGKFTQALTKAITRWATAKRWRENLPQVDKEKSPTVEVQKSESSSATEQKEGPRGAAPAAGQCPHDPKKKRTYKEPLAACKEWWTRHKEGRENAYEDLPFVDEIDDPFKLKKVVLSKKKALNVSIAFSNTQGSKEGRALIDSGTTENFIDERTARRWELPMHNLVYPRKVFNVDGTENRNGMIIKS
jgi:hypothetical protein